MDNLWQRFLHNTRAGNLFYNIFIGWRQCDALHSKGRQGWYCQGMKGHFGQHTDCSGHRWK